MKAQTFSRICGALMALATLAAIACVATGEYLRALSNSACGLVIWFVHLPFFEKMQLTEEQEIKRLKKEIEDGRKNNKTGD